MLVIAAPGQGAQAPGFLTPWLDLPGFADRLAAWSDLAGCDLIRYGTTAGAEEITDTAIAQPLLVAAAIAVSVISSVPAVVPYLIRSHPARSDHAVRRSAKPGRSSHGVRKPGVCAP